MRFLVLIFAGLKYVRHLPIKKAQVQILPVLELIWIMDKTSFEVMQFHIRSLWIMDSPHPALFL